MAQLNVNRTRDLLQDFDFQTLFIEELGWEKPRSAAVTLWNAAGRELQGREIASLAGVTVIELIAADGEIPDSKARLAAWREVAKVHHENLLIFLDTKRTQSLWYWVKRGEKGKVHARDHYFFQGQPGDLFLSKLASLVVDVADFDEEGRASVADIAQRLKRALDVERVTKRFYNEFKEEHDRFLEQIEGITDERERRWYTSVLLNRLMFVYFLQKKRFLDKEDLDYLRNKLTASQALGPDRFYGFLKTLFFEGFAKPADERAPEIRRLLGDIRYLNGGLFLPHKVEIQNPGIRIPDVAFERILTLFSSYSWNLDDTPGGDDQEINPDVLGYIFEKYINQKAFGAYYTRPEITRYLCEQTIYPLILSKVNTAEIPGVAARPNFESIEDLLLKLDARLCRKLLDEVLPGISILDPACGSGAFLVAALKVLIDVYSVVVGRAKFTNDRFLRDWFLKIEKDHPSINYWIKKRIITDNLFGVDIMEEATEITKLRLFLALVASATSVDDLEPLPNIDFNILPGNSLIGLLHVHDEEFDRRQPQGHLFRRTFKQITLDKNRKIEQYRNVPVSSEKLRELRDEIEAEKREANATLNDMLLGEFTDLGIKFEEATWDVTTKKEGKPKRRTVAFKDVAFLRPFHWGYEFDKVLEGGGFDVILTNPPWEVFKPQAKEFFAEHSEIVYKNKMTIKDFEKEQGRLLKSAEIRQAWLEYQSRFPHVSLFFRTSDQYTNQISIVNGRKAGTDINLYKLFLERCFRLLREGGGCGVLLPTSIYSDLGSKRLREMLFGEAKVEALFGLSNERFIFEGVDHRFKICLLVFEKGGETARFEAAFRIDPREAVQAERLETFLNDKSQHTLINVDLIRKLSPDSLSIPELKTEIDSQIAGKVTIFPLLGERLEGAWNLRLCREFDMTNDSYLFSSSKDESSLPLYEGKMIHQYSSSWGEARYWIKEAEGRKAVLGRGSDLGQVLDYEKHRLAFRDIAHSTNERTMIAAILPRRVFAGNTLNLSNSVPSKEMLVVLAFLNSFVLDSLIRQKVSSHCNMFYVYQLPVPRLTSKDKVFELILDRSSRLVCVSEEYAELWSEVVESTWVPAFGATNPAERAKLRAELDGLIAHVYNLTEDEFAHILSTFPVVAQGVKDAALEAYRQFAPKPGDPEILALISQGESHSLEFKSTARWNLRTGAKDPEMEKAIQKTVAGFLNREGGTLLIGVADDGSVVGLEPDFQTFKKKNRDGFELFLTDLLLGGYDRDLAPCIRVTFHPLDGKEVCRVSVTKSPRPVYLKEGNDEVLYVRMGNSTRRLSLREALEYAKTRWG